MSLPVEEIASVIKKYWEENDNPLDKFKRSFSIENKTKKEKTIRVLRAAKNYISTIETWLNQDFCSYGTEDAKDELKEIIKTWTGGEELKRIKSLLEDYGIYT